MLIFVPKWLDQSWPFVWE